MIWLTSSQKPGSPVLVNENNLLYVWPQSSGSILIFVGDRASDQGLPVNEDPGEIFEVIMEARQ